MTRVELTASSAADLERKQAALQERADASGESFEVVQRFSVGRNVPCVCLSGKKYKRCCAGADETVIVVWPAGQEPPRRKKRRGVIPMGGLITGLLGWACRGRERVQ